MDNERENEGAQESEPEKFQEPNTGNLNDSEPEKFQEPNTLEKQDAEKFQEPNTVP